MMEFEPVLGSVQGRLWKTRMRPGRGQLAQPLSSTGSWSLSGLLWGITGGVADVLLGIANIDYLEQSIALMAGLRYEVSLMVLSRTAGSVQLEAGGNVVVAAQSAPGVYTSVYDSTGGNVPFRINGNLFSGTVSKISVRALE